MAFFVIFARKGKIVAVEEGDASDLNWKDSIFLKVVEAKRMGPRILKRIMEEG